MRVHSILKQEFNMTRSFQKWFSMCWTKIKKLFQKHWAKSGLRWRKVKQFCLVSSLVTKAEFMNAILKKKFKSCAIIARWTTHEKKLGKANQKSKACWFCFLTAVKFWSKNGSHQGRWWIVCTNYITILQQLYKQIWKKTAWFVRKQLVYFASW